MAPTPQSKLSKTEKGRLKKLLKRASFDPKSNSPGITCHDEALEIKHLLKKANPAGCPKDSAHIGPSIHHVHSNYGEWQDAENWKQTEGADIRNLIQSFVFGSTQESTKGSNGNTKKRKRTENNSYEGTIPSWAKLHNIALQENLAVIEFDVTTSSQDPTSIMPSRWIGSNDANKESILTKLISEEGHDGKRALPLRCRLFQGEQPRHTTDILMYLEKMSKKSKSNPDEEECRTFSSDREIHDDAFKKLSKLLLPLHTMKFEGYPIHAKDSGKPLHPSLLVSAKKYEIQDSRKKEFELFFDPEHSKAIVESMKVKVSLGEDQDTDLTGNQSIFVKTSLSRNCLSDASLIPKVFSIDCEMVRTTEKFELARLTLLEFSPTIDDPDRYIVVLDMLAKPKNQIKDYVTKYSGITPNMLENVSTSLEEIQASLLAIICEEDIIIGQSLENDLKALHLVHYNVVDTAVLFKSDEGRKHSLKRLSAVLLKRQIQTNASSGHCSEEDAAAALLLALGRARLGAGFQMQDKAGRKNLFSLTSRLKREPVDEQPGFLKHNNGPIVCIGPNEWIKEHIATQSTVNALECSNISSSAVKAVTSYLRQSGRRSSVLWSKLSMCTDDISEAEMKTKIDEIIVSMSYVCFLFVMSCINKIS